MAADPKAIITLTTDFGLSDPYVAAMKAVVLAINPEAVLVDICHTIQPQNVLRAAFLFSTVYGYFPPQTIHIVVVDPGVGTSRRALLLTTPEGRFLAPDNGVLSYVVASPTASPESETSASWLAPGMRQPPLREVSLGERMSAYALTRPQWWRHPVSATFHGRDIFAPVAGHLSLGKTPEQVGEPLSQINAFSLPRPRRLGPGQLVGHILHVDGFGNLITNIREADLPDQSGRLRLEVRGHVVQGISITYAQGEDIVALIGSSGYLEIAAREASAARRLGAGVGDQVLVAAT